MTLQCAIAAVGGRHRPVYARWIGNAGTMIQTLYQFTGSAVQNRPVFIRMHNSSDLGLRLSFLLSQALVDSSNVA